MKKDVTFSIISDKMEKNDMCATPTLTEVM